MPKCNTVYKQRTTFFTLKFDQIRPKIATFRPFFSFQNSQIHLGIAQLIPPKCLFTVVLWTETQIGQFQLKIII